jgi:hypothetical protein
MIAVRAPCCRAVRAPVEAVAPAAQTSGRWWRCWPTVDEPGTQQKTKHQNTQTEQQQKKNQVDYRVAMNIQIGQRGRQLSAGLRMSGSQCRQLGFQSEIVLGDETLKQILYNHD